MTVTYVVTWRWLDGSGSGPVSVHWTQAGAELMKSLLDQHGDSGKEYVITPTPTEPLP